MYTLASAPFVANTTIASALVNADFNDLVNDANTPRPLTAGGTGGASQIAGWDGLTAKGTDIPSAATINLTTATGPRIDITGTTTITAVTLANGSWRLARATGAFQLTASASLVVNKSTSVNYTTTAGDLLIFTAEGGVVSVSVVGAALASTTVYGITKLATNALAEAGSDATTTVTPAALGAILNAGADNSGGATITMGDGGYFNLITSTTAITAFAFTNDAIGRTARIRFSTVRTLTYNATSLIIPGAANITTAVGDIMQIRSLGSGNFVVDWYTQTAYPPPSGGEVLLATITPTAVATLTQTGLPTNFNMFRFEFQAIQPATGSAIGFQLNISSDNGSTFDTATNIAGVSSGSNIQGMGWLGAVGVTSSKVFTGVIGTVGTSGNSSQAVYSTKTSPTNAVRFTFSGGQNFVAQGSIKIFGVR